MSPAFSGLGPTVGTYAERVALASPPLGQLFYQYDTDEYVKYGIDTDGTNRWMLADHDYGRNLVVNGGFDVWQRATSATTSTADYYGPADRWQTVRLSSDNQRTFSRQPVTSSDTPVSGFTYFMRCQRNAATVATNSILMATSFETTSVRRTQNKYVTLSFFARAGANYSAASGFLRAFITGGTGTDGRLITGSFTSPTTLVDSNNVLTTSWKRFTVTTSAPVGSTVTQMGVTFQFTPVGTAGAADYYDITGVQLEAASAPSDFEFEDFGTTLRKCQRYFEKSYDAAVAPGTNTGAGQPAYWGGTQSDGFVGGHVKFVVTKRVTPSTIQAYTEAGVLGSWTILRAGAQSNAAANVLWQGQSGMNIYVNTGVANTVARVNGHWTASAEL